MAKGLRCKTKRAFRAVKRQHVATTVEVKRMEGFQQKLRMIQQGQDVMALHKRPLNKFLHPDAPEAEFPQRAPGVPPLDFRSEVLPLAGLVGAGQRKKFSEEEKLEIVSIFNCLPGRTEGPQVRQAREAFRRREALGEMDMQPGIMPEYSSSSSSSAAAGGEEGEGEMAAEDAAAQVLAEMRRQQIPVVKDTHKQRAAQRPRGRYRPKGR